MGKRLIATDFDGTLNIQGKVSGFDRKMLAEWRARGNYFGIVTGRGLDFYKTVREIGIDSLLDYLIIYNGSFIGDMNGNCLYESFIPRDIFFEIQQFLSGFADIEHYDKVSDKEFYHQYYATFPDYARALGVASQINEKFGSEITAFVNGPHINIAKKGSSKSEGVKFILSHYGLQPGEGAVVGDDYNDLQMITDHRGWAIRSGRPEVVAAAEHTCSSVGALAAELMGL